MLKNQKKVGGIFITNIVPKFQRYQSETELVHICTFLQFQEEHFHELIALYEFFILKVNVYSAGMIMHKSIIFLCQSNEIIKVWLFEVYYKLC
ncbi:hypothetical protein FGO68_gene12956 [Halteria grandinella]|uniref:Uncharacterized protein n=1 Tax=Halteria grandinella TaxID=5974 RepID=A0A8J8P573_HALGN|nr:hypothetical protein FGO68_gene12956 [Halteria grandinella]